MRLLSQNRYYLHSASRLLLVCSCMLAVLSCAYFNTVYNAKNYYRQGKKQVSHDTLVIDSENFDKAIEKSTSIIVKYPNTHWVDDALFMMGASYYYKGDYSRSLDKLDFLILNYPESSFYYEAQYIRGLANYKLKKYGAAIIAFDEAMVSKKFKKKSMVALIYVYFNDGSYSDMYELADSLMKSSLKYDEQRTVLRFVSMAQFSEERYTDALETSRRLLDITREERERRELKLRIAEIYLEIGEYDLCRNFVEGEVEPEFRNLLADLCMETGDVEEAKAIYVELARSTVANMAAEAFFELAQIYEQRDSLDLAVAYYDSALVKSPNSEYGLSARKKSDVLKRIQTLTTSAEDTVKAQFLLAEIYFSDLDDLPKALQGYQRVYNGYPNSRWAPKALYAHFWIAKNVYDDDTLAARLAQVIIRDYPRTEYAISAQSVMGQSGETAETND